MSMEDLPQVDIAFNSLNPYVIVSALVLSILVAALFFGRSGRDRFQGFLGKLSSFFNFRVFWLTGIAKFLYALLFFTAIGMGIATIVGGQVLMGVAMLVLLPALLRLLVECLMIMLSIREESEHTNDYLRELIKLQKGDSTPKN